MSNVVCLIYVIAFAAAASFIARQPDRLTLSPSPSHLSTTIINEQH
jgi:hypothetical protein